MNSGSLCSRIVLQSQSVTQDDIGQPLTTWSDVALVWADIKHISGVSAIKAGMDTSIVKCSIRIRYLAGINAGMRVLHAGVAYQIEAVLPNLKERTLDLVCAATNANA